MRNFKSLRKSNFLYGLFYAAVFLIFLAPLLRLLLMSITQDAGYGFSHYTRLLAEVRTRKAIVNTIYIAVFSTLFSTFWGSLFAFLTAYTNIKHKKTIEMLVLMPFIVPAYIITLSWTTILSANGVLSHILMKIGLAPVSLYNMEGIIFVQGICHIPLVYLILKSMLRKIPADLEWASLAAGFSRWQTILRVNLTLALPAVASGAVLSFLAAIDNFSIPAFLGTPAGIPVLSTYIYEKTISFGPSSFSDAAVLSVILSAIAVAGTLVESFFMHRGQGLESIKEDSSVRITMSPETRKAVEWSVLAGLAGFNVIPLLFMIMGSFQKVYGLGYGLGNLSCDNFRVILTNAGIMRSIRNSLFLALITGLICLVIGTTAAYLKIRKNNGAMKVLEKSASVTYAIPGMVLALSMIFHWVEPLPGIRPGFYGTITILVIAYVTRYLILQIKGSANAILTIEPTLEEAALASGRTWISVWTKIILPMMFRPLMSSAFLIFIPAMTELTLSSILSAAGTKTIGLTIFNFQQAGDYSLSTAMSAMVVVLILGGYAVGFRCNKFLEHRKEKKYDRVETGTHISPVWDDPSPQ